jgi:CAAX prenyl protease-like protein
VCHLELERTFLVPLTKPFGLDRILGLPARTAFNPFEQLSGYPIGIALYLVVRGIGLAFVVPIVEEYFLRGFLMRYVVTEKWWKHPIGSVTRNSVIAATVVPMLMHPSELIAAAIWFSLITVLYVRSKNLWECIAAHSTTNLLLGIYVVLFGAWQLV